MAYAAGDTLVRAVMTAASGVVADQITNDFAFKFDAVPTAGDYANVEGYVSDFYRVVQSSGHSVSSFLSNQVNRSVTHLLESYKIVAGPLGSPVHSQAWLGPLASSNPVILPEEVAACLSYNADLTGEVERGPVVSDVPTSEAAQDAGAPAVHSGASKPKARRRGRLFIGPLNLDALVATTPPGYLDPAFLTTMRQAAVALQAAATAGGWAWCVWSRRDQVLRPVVGGWTDNAPDTQRRRGPKSNARVTYTV